MHERSFPFAYAVSALLALSSMLGASQSARQTDTSVSPAQIAIAGKVIDWQGRAVDGAKVTLCEVTYIQWVFWPKVEVVQEVNTGLDGTFSLAAVQTADPLRGGVVVARKDGLALGWTMCGLQGDQRFDVALGQPKDLVGEVLDEKGQPVADAEVSIAFAVMGKAEDQRLLAVPGLLSTRTDRNGRFVFAGVPAGASFEFIAHKPGKGTVSTAAQTGLDLLSRMTYQRVRLQFSPEQMDIRLSLPAEAGVEGIVVEKSRGQPVGGLRVVAQAERRQDGLLSPDPIAAAADGTFRISGLAAGNWFIKLLTTRGQTAEWVAEPVPVSLKANETKSGVRLELTEGGIIEVLVKDASGKPVVRAGVGVRHAQGAQSAGGSTDNDGLTRIRVLPGRYRVFEPRKQGYSPRTGEVEATVEENTTTRVEFTLDVAAKLVGIVRDEAGNPRADVKIAFAPIGPVEIATDADGKFTVGWFPRPPGLEAGSSVLVARDVGRNLVETIEVDEQTRNLNLTLKPGAIFTGTVLNHEGAPVANTRVSVALRLEKVHFGFREQATTTRDGTFEVRAIPPGLWYTIAVRADGWGRDSLFVDVSAFKGDRRDSGQFKLALAGLSISGVVVDSHDKPVAGARVSANDGVGFVGEDVQTDADGRFLIKGVSSGPILLMASIERPKWMSGEIHAKGGATDVRIVVE